MRNLFTVASVATITLLSACGGETCSDGSDPVDDECPCVDGTYPSDNVDGECPSGVDCGVGEVESNGECFVQCDNGDLADDEADCPLDLDPVAVGFEFDGVFDGNTLRGYSFDDGSGQLVELLPLVLVTFANADFFSSTTEEDQLANSCEAYATFDFIAGESQLVGATMESSDTAVVWNHFDTSLSILPNSWEFEGDTQLDNGCAFALDSEIWGNDGIDLLDAFTGVHFGIGFGPQTDYLASAWQDENGDWANETIEELSVGMMTSYIAINDAAGANDSTEPFEGYDWTTSIAFEWNDETGELVADEEGLLQVIDVTDADELPVSYIRSFAYWYQDFPLLDLDDLGQGRPIDDGSGQ